MPIFYENFLKAYKKYPNIFEEAKKVKEIYAHIVETKAIDLKTRLKNIENQRETPGHTEKRRDTQGNTAHNTRPPGHPVHFWEMF